MNAFDMQMITLIILGGLTVFVTAYIAWRI
jgi:hypothetical protein